jgi:GNAT superfamily N-acetyltransferase
MGLDIRDVMPDDRERLVEISKLTWEGSDYLEQVIDQWMAEGGFYVAVVDGIVAGTVKMSSYPDRVCWLEGLRVHPDFRGRGLAGEMTAFVLGRARALMDKGAVDGIEFATYYKNEASIHLGLSNGFSVTERFYVLSREMSDDAALKKVEPASSLDQGTITPADFDGYDNYLPSGWELCHRTAEGVDWLVSRSRFYCLSGQSRFYTFEGSGCYSLLDFRPQSVLAVADSISRLSRQNGRDWHEIIFPERHSEMLRPLLDVGYEFWEEPEEPCMLAFRLDGSAAGPT